MAHDPASQRERLKLMLDAQMPVAQRLGFSIESLTARSVTLRAEFELNRNHQGSAFAGSLHALATLTGWSVVWLTLQEAGLAANAVLQDSRIQYLHPVMTDFSATCDFPPADVRAQLLLSLERHRRGRLPISVDVRAEGRTVATFAGRYVALLPTS